MLVCELHAPVSHTLEPVKHKLSVGPSYLRRDSRLIFNSDWNFIAANKTRVVLIESYVARTVLYVTER